MFKFPFLTYWDVFFIKLVSDANLLLSPGVEAVVIDSKDTQGQQVGGDEGEPDFHRISGCQLSLDIDGVGQALQS